MLVDVKFAKGEDTSEVVKKKQAAKSDERNPGIASHLTKVSQSSSPCSTEAIVTILPVGLSHLAGDSVQNHLVKNGWMVVKKIDIDGTEI